jgi:archaellum component FlaC
MISANGVEYKNLPEQVQYLTERAAEFAVELNRVSTSLEGVTTNVESLQANVEGLQTDVAALQTSYTTLAEDVRIDKVNINTIFGNLGTIFTDITNIKNGTTHLFETITDRHGNLRFVEGNITMETIEGVTQTYGKWSLSGTHLMIVIMFKANNGTTFGNLTIAKINLPSYIFDKILIVHNNDVETKTFNGWANDYTAQTLTLHLRKLSSILDIDKGGAPLTLTADRSFRIQYDHIIDAS